jgi:hypothetical protein
MMKDIHSYSELSEESGKERRSFLLLYKSGSEMSDCAFKPYDYRLRSKRSSFIVGRCE